MIRKKCHRCSRLAWHGHDCCKQHLKMNADYAREQYRIRRKAGLCVRCPADNIQDALPGYATCADHTIASRNAARINMRKSRKEKKK